MKKFVDKYGSIVFVNETQDGFALHQSNNGRNVELPHTQEVAKFDWQGTFLGLRQKHWPQSKKDDMNMASSLCAERLIALQKAIKENKLID